MPYLQLDNTQFPLLTGETRVGKGETADVQLPVDATGIDAIITVSADFSASVRRESSAAVITVNGITIDTQPSPLFHGDRLSIDGVGLLYADESHTGATMQIEVVRSDAPLPPPHRSATRSTRGGRLVSLMDGREYGVPDAGLVIGREPGCDIVVAASDVSRRHARLELMPQGYVLSDTSTNGVLVNGIRVQRSQPLARGDMIQIGPEEFRFHAEATPQASEVAVEPEPAASNAELLPAPVIEQPSPDSIAPAAAVPAPAPAPAAAPAPAPVAPRVDAAPAATRPLLATLEVINEGPTKGTRFRIDTQLAHVGRGAHNDVVINDESVSDTHAKIQRRERGWFVVDMNSTNGSYVAGQRVQGEQQLESGADVRFGGVKLLFRVIGATQDEGGGTRVIVGYRGRTPAVLNAEESSVPANDSERGRRRSALIVATLLMFGFLLAYLILTAR